MLCWSRDIPVQETDVSYAEMKRIDLYPHARTYEMEDASHFLHEDAPSSIVQRIEEFLKANP